MIVVVCGSRDWGDYASVWNRLSCLPGEHERITIIHGACSRKHPVTGEEMSADMIADHAAHSLGFIVRRFPADWSKGKGAGKARNKKMLDEQPDEVIAFQRDGSWGTQHTINEARRRGIPVDVVAPDAQPSSPGPTHTEQESE